MATKVVRSNLSAANFPLVASDIGQTIIIQQYDNNFVSNAPFSGNDKDRDRGIPQVYYAENVMPCEEGLRSVGFRSLTRPYTDLVEADTPYPQNVNILGDWKIHDLAGAKARLVALALFDSAWDEQTGILLLGWTVAYGWRKVTLFAGATGSVQVANIAGATYILVGHQPQTMYSYTLASNSIAPVVNEPTGSTAGTLRGINLATTRFVAMLESSGYLILFTTMGVYWSSTLDPLDFIPSLTTGAGAGDIAEIDGAIVTARKSNTGFHVFTLANIVTAVYSGNATYPWTFKAAAGSGGIPYEGANARVAPETDAPFTLALTSAGMLKVTNQGCQGFMPEVSDLLAGRIYDEFDSETKTLKRVQATQGLEAAISFCSSRYIVISYKPRDSSGTRGLPYSHALVYDAQLERWGKVKQDHRYVVTVAESKKDSSPIAYTGMGDTTYQEMSEIAYIDMFANTSDSAEVNESLALVRDDGVYRMLNSSRIPDQSRIGVIMLGRFKLTQAPCTILGVKVSNISEHSSVTLLTSTQGYSPSTVRELTPAWRDGELANYPCRVTGDSHTVLIEGDFYLTALDLEYAKSGRR